MTSSGAPGVPQAIPAEQADQPNAAEQSPIYEPTPEKAGSGRRHSPEAFLAAMGSAVLLSNSDKIISVAGKVGSGVISAMGAGGGVAAATAETGAVAAEVVAAAPNLIASIVESTLSTNGIGLGLEMGGKALEAGASTVLSALATTGKFAVEGAVSIVTNPMVLTTLALYGAYVYRDKLAALAKKVAKLPKTMWTKMIKSEVKKSNQAAMPRIPNNGALAAATG